MQNSRRHLVCAVVAAVLGIVGVASGCWDQNRWVFGLGVLILAASAAVIVVQLVGRRIVDVLLAIGAVLVLLAAGFGIPTAVGRPHGDVVWKTSVRPDGNYCYTRVMNNRLYAYRCGGGITVLAPATGKPLWNSAAEAVLSDGGVLRTTDSRSRTSISLEYVAADGSSRWTSDQAVSLPDGGSWVQLAARTGTVVTASCRRDKVADCTYIGTGPSGKPVWRRQLPGTPDLHRPDTVSELHQTLPQTLAVVADGRDHDRFLVVDPVTGRTVIDQQLPEGTQAGYGDAWALGDQILLPTNDFSHNRCAWSLYDDQKRLWTTNGLCEQDNGQHMTTRIYRVTDHLIYVGTGAHLAVIDRQTGRSRVLSEDEALLAEMSTLPDPLYDQADLVSDRVILSFDLDQLVGTDPMSGRRLWSRDLYPGTRATVGDGGGIALTMPGQVFNPMVHSAGDSGARTIEYVDPASGRTISRAFEPDGIDTLQVVDGRGVLVVPASNRPSYLMGPR